MISAQIRPGSGDDAPTGEQQITGTIAILSHALTDELSNPFESSADPAAVIAHHTAAAFLLFIEQLRCIALETVQRCSMGELSGSELAKVIALHRRLQDALLEPGAPRQISRYMGGC